MTVVYTAPIKDVVNSCECVDIIFGLDKLESLKLYRMRCPECGTGTCKVTNLSRKYEAILRDVNPELLLPTTELGILEALYGERRDLMAAEIAEDLDCSYQLVGKRGKKSWSRKGWSIGLWNKSVASLGSRS
jgi:hypothetical protein